MTRLCVPLFYTDLSQIRRDMALAAEHGADLVELRIDSAKSSELRDEDWQRALAAEIKMPAIITCRTSAEGGQCQLDEEDRLAVLTAFAKNERVAYVDIELQSHSLQPF